MHMLTTLEPAPQKASRRFSNKRSATRGFTIVELLIVIVVIAILAAISIVAYVGIQQKARNIARVSAARQALTLLQTYKASEGQYPAPPDNLVNPSTPAACIGEGWPLLNGDPVCWNIYTDGGAWGNSTFPQDEEVNSELARFGSLPNYPKTPVWSGNTSGRPMDLSALALIRRSVGNSYFHTGYSLAYILEGDNASTDCGLPAAIKTGFSRESATRCVVPLGE